MKLTNWEKETNILRNIFIEKYFGEVDEYDFWWIGEEIGGTLAVNDYFFNLERILDALRYNASKKKFFDYYDEELKLQMKDKKMKYNFEHYLKIK